MSINKKVIGEATRRKVMGDNFVDAVFNNASSFDLPMQDLACEVAWGGSWSKDGPFTLRERSIITISMLIALNAHTELIGHVRGALNNGCSSDEIRDVILHSATYCGFPAAMQAMTIAKKVTEEFRSE